MRYSIATIINYCTNDYRYLDLCIEQAKKFSQQIIIPVCDHFFDGTKENRELLNRSYSEHPDCQFIEFAYDSHTPYGSIPPVEPGDENWAHYWHSTSRYIGYQFIDASIDYVMFIDVDEIFDSERFLKWLEVFPCENYSALRFESFFYFRESKYRVKSEYTLNALMMQKSYIPFSECILTIYERKGLYYYVEGEKVLKVSGLDGYPLVHHYSWVRTEEELFKKVNTWGHRHDQDWNALLKQEFENQHFTGKDLFFNGVSYETIEPLCDPLRKDIESIKKENSYQNLSLESFPHVKLINHKTLFEHQVEKMLQS